MNMTVSLEKIENRSELLRDPHTNLLTYKAFRALIQNLHAQKLVTGHDQSESLLAYSLLNEQRMNRWDKHYQVGAELNGVMQQMPAGWHMVVIAEGWCGDAAQMIPALHQMAMLGTDWKFSIVLRDDHPQWMDAFLSGGARAIPIAILFDANQEYVVHWGPRPQEAVQLIKNAKEQGIPTDVWKTTLHKWYATNKQMALESEWIALLQPLSQK
jgi:Thioredoxin